MNKQDLLLRAAQLKKEGDFLLEESNLVSFLSQYGKVCITGSYSVDLMTMGDIDIYVVLNDFSRETAKKILIDLIDLNYFRGYYFGDYIQHPKEGFPSGYYVGANKIHKDEFWKFDLWFVETTDSEKDNFMELLANRLDEETRFKILKRKHERDIQKMDITSFEIYKEILNI